VLDFDQPQVFLRRESFECGGLETWGGNGFDKKLCHFFGGGGVDDAIDADDTSECGDWIALEGLLVSIHQFRGRCRAAWVGVLDDGADGSSYSCARSHAACRSTMLL